MKIACVYFAYQKDQELLKLSLDNLDFLKRYDDIDVYVIDDAACPMSEIPKNVFYQQSKFDRKGNMNGAECFVGMIDVFNSIFDKKDYDWIIKIDGDTIVNSWKWLRNVNPQQYVQVGTYNQCWGMSQNIFVIPYGTVHGYSKIGIDNINKHIKEKFDYWKSITRRFPEDVFGARMACNDNEDLNFYITNYVNNPILDNTEIGIYFDYAADYYINTEENIPLELLIGYSAITFKSHTSQYKNNNQIRAKCSLRMHEYVRKGLNKIERFQ